MIRHIIKYAILKWKWRGKVRFSWNSQIGFHSEFEGMNQVHPYANFSGYMGYGSYVASYSSLYGKIGKFCSIASYVRCNNGRHPYTYPYVTTAPCFFSSNIKTDGHLRQNRNTPNLLMQMTIKNMLLRLEMIVGLARERF